MTDQAPVIARIPARSMGLKLLLVCGLALLMSIPAVFVVAILMDRTHRARDVTKEVGQLMGGPQTFLGPVLAVPYEAPPAAANQPPTRGVLVIYPERASASAVAASEVRQRSLFRVPVYHADLSFRAAFDLKGAGSAAPDRAALDWSRAEILVGLTDPRGAQSDIVLNIGGRTFQPGPSDLMSRQGSGGAPAGPDDLSFFGTRAGGLVGPEGAFQAEARLRVSGAQRLAVLPYGKTTTLRVQSDWADPSFDGGFPPVSKQIGEKGFTADWSVPFIARGVPGKGEADSLSRLEAGALGVTLADPASPYQSVGRSLKYAILFVGLVFLAYFLFETTTGRRVHPAQYVLIGLAQVIFYLLLLSIAEQIGFDGAFLAAAGATVGLISAYAGWVFESRRQGLVSLAAFSLLYGLIYVLMRLEDLALLVGAVASFAAISTVMYFTRRLDWYGVTDQGAKGSV